MQTTLELFLCTMMDEKTVIYHRAARDISDNTEDPDNFLEAILSELIIYIKPENIYTHSTSWRFESQGIILTYIALAPYSSMMNLPVKELYQDETLQNPKGPLSPRPEVIDEEDVVVHGLGHLRYLAEKKDEPFLLETLEKTGVMETLTQYPTTVAGRLHM